MDRSALVVGIVGMRSIDFVQCFGGLLGSVFTVGGDCQQGKLGVGVWVLGGMLATALQGFVLFFGDFLARFTGILVVAVSVFIILHDVQV